VAISKAKTYAPPRGHNSEAGAGEKTGETAIQKILNELPLRGGEF
jgi:hypothetical protein